MKPQGIKPPRRVAMLAFGVCAGMAGFSAEALWDLGTADGSLLAYGLFWYGLLAAIYFGLAGEIARLALQRGWYSATYSLRPPLAGGLVALGLPVLVVYWFVHLFEDQLPTTRLILFFIVLVGSGLFGWCVARALAARPGVWLARLVRFAWRPWPVALGLLLLTGYCSWRIVAPEAEPGLVRASESEPVVQVGPDLIWIRVRGLDHRAGLGPQTGLSPMPKLEALARKGVVFSSASERAWPSIAWPWPFSHLEPWIRPAAHSDPSAAGLDDSQLAERLGKAGFRCRAQGAKPKGLGQALFEDPGHAQRELQRSLWLSRWMGRSLGALGFAQGSRAAPSLEACFPFLAQDPDSWGLAERVLRQACPGPAKRDFLYISLDEPAWTSNRVDSELGLLFDRLGAAELLGQALVVVTSWPVEASVPTATLPKRMPLIVAGPGIPAGRRIQTPISIQQLPAAVLAQLGLEGDFLDPGVHNQLLSLLVGD